MHGHSGNSTTKKIRDQRLAKPRYYSALTEDMIIWGKGEGSGSDPAYNCTVRVRFSLIHSPSSP